MNGSVGKGTPDFVIKQNHGGEQFGRVAVRHLCELKFFEQDVEMVVNGKEVQHNCHKENLNLHVIISHAW